MDAVTKMTVSLNHLIQIDPQLVTPVYKQIVQSICRNIEKGVLKKDDMLPSVNSIAETFSLARGSVFTAYNDLRSSGIIDSVPGKGYFIVSTATKQRKNIFLLFSCYNPYLENLYTALRTHLPDSCSLDIFFYNDDDKLFETLIREKASYYNTFVIMPGVVKDTAKILSKLDQKQLFLLNTGFKEYKKLYPGVYQNAERDIYNILKSLEQQASKYKRLILLTPEKLKAKEIIAGFNKFTGAQKIRCKVQTSFDASDFQKLDGFIITDDKDLVKIVETTQKMKWQLGKDIGIISYSETILKSVIGGGITTITTDYEAMGKAMAQMVETGKCEVIENPIILTNRQSF